MKTGKRHQYKEINYLICSDFRKKSSFMAIQETKFVAQQRLIIRLLQILQQSWLGLYMYCRIWGYIFPNLHLTTVILSTLALSSNPVYHSIIKHLDIDFHFVCERVQKTDLVVQYIPIEEQLANIFTKGLHSPIFVQHCRNMRLGTPSKSEESG